jgi:hypothetical protein
VSEEVVPAYEVEKENWLRNLSAARAARVRALLKGERVDYRIRKAEEGLGCPIEENRLHVELALLASQWLGATVLRHVTASRPRQPGRTSQPSAAHPHRDVCPRASSASQPRS